MTNKTNQNTANTILLIDDDDFLLDMYSLKFKQSGFEVDTAGNSADVLEKIRGDFSPDVVLLDLVMPDFDGFDFLTTIKEEKLLKNSLIIVLSNLGQKENIDKASELGADDYIIKAYFTPSEVVEKVKDLIKKHNK